MQKSLVFFGNKCLDAIKVFVKNKLEVSNEVLQNSYLDMPTKIARSATSSFNFLVDKVWRCVTSIDGCPLSRDGKEV
jgi:hypothetical protein